MYFALLVYGYEDLTRFESNIILAESFFYFSKC
jgi:hypothetical protein